LIPESADSLFSMNFGKYFPSTTIFISETMLDVHTAVSMMRRYDNIQKKEWNFFSIKEQLLLFWLAIPQRPMLSDISSKFDFRTEKFLE